MQENQELPDLWIWTTVGNIGKVTSGGTPQSTDPNNFGTDVAWVTPADLSGYTEKYISEGARSLSEKGVNSCSANIIPAGSVLFSSRAPVGYVVIAANDISTNQGFKNITPNAEIVESEYAYYYLKASKRLAESYASGTTFLELSGKNFSRLPFPLAPLPEQRRIVAKLEELFSRLDAGVATLRQTQAQLKRYRQSVLHAAVTGELTRAWREQKIKQGYNEDALGWEETTVGGVTINLDSKRKPVSKKIRQQSQGKYPYYGANGQTGWIDDFLFDEELVLVVEDETFTGRTKPFCYKVTGKTWVNNHAHVLKPKTVLTIDYLNYSLAFYPFTPLTTGTTGRKKLTKAALTGAPYLLPSLEEQTQIVAEIEQRISVLDSLEQTLTAELTRAERLRQSILHRAFTGQLVPQDATDEPAAALLARLHGEPATALPSPTKGKHGRKPQAARQTTLGL